MEKSNDFMTSDNLHIMELLSPPKGAGAHFGRFLQRKGLTAAEAARDLGVSKSTITRLVKGNAKLSIELAAEMKRVYNVPVALLFRLEAEYKAYLVSQKLERTNF